MIFEPKTNSEAQDKLPYTSPAIVFEIELETRAGTPMSIGGDDPLDMSGLDTLP